MDEMAVLRRRIDTLGSRDAVREAMCRDWCVLDLTFRSELEDCFTEDADREAFSGFIGGRRVSVTPALDRG